jgi:hypothetical protein
MESKLWFEKHPSGTIFLNFEASVIEIKQIIQLHHKSVLTFDIKCLDTFIIKISLLDYTLYSSKLPEIIFHKR